MHEFRNCIGSKVLRKNVVHGDYGDCHLSDFRCLSVVFKNLYQFDLLQTKSMAPLNFVWGKQILALEKMESHLVLGYDDNFFSPRTSFDTRKNGLSSGATFHLNTLHNRTSNQHKKY